VRTRPDCPLEGGYALRCRSLASAIGLGREDRLHRPYVQGSGDCDSRAVDEVGESDDRADDRTVFSLRTDRPYERLVVNDRRVAQRGRDPIGECRLSRAAVTVDRRHPNRHRTGRWPISDLAGDQFEPHPLGQEPHEHRLPEVAAASAGRAREPKGSLLA
jgi:hypothetical protein